MSEVYIIQNQDKLFLSKQRTWVDGREPASLFRTPHKDEAVNEKFEVNAKDYSQRVRILECPLNERGVPVIDPALLPEPGENGESTMSLDLNSDEAAAEPAEAEPSAAHAG